MKKLLGMFGTLAIGVGGVSTGTVLAFSNNYTTSQNVEQVNTLAVQSELQTFTITAQAFDVDWLALNNLIDAGFTDSNDYAPWLETYSSGWFDFGWKAIFPEGDINVMRLVKIITSTYDQVNFAPLENLLTKGMNLFDYITNVEEHLNDKVSVLVGLVKDLISEMNSSPIPFANALMEQLNSMSRILNFLKNQDLSLMLPIFKSQIQNLSGMSLEEIGEKYTTLFKTGLWSLKIANYTLATLNDYLPGVIFNYMMNNITWVASSMVEADANHNGVELIVKSYVWPDGFRAHN